MRILGLLGFCLFTFLMPLSFGNNVYAQNQYSVTDRSVEIVSGIAEVSGVLPEVAFSSFSARSFADEINNAVNAEFEKIVSSTAGKKAKISFSYEIKEYNDIVSLLLKSDVTVVSVQNAVSTFNFNPTLRRFVTISDVDVLGVNGAELVNSALSEEIKRDVDKYKANFKGINDGQDFFVEDGTVYVVFDKDEIAYGFAGVIYFPIKIADVREVVIDAENYYISPEFSTRMIKLFAVSDALEFELGWDGKTSVVDVFMPDKQPVTFRIGENAYFKGSLQPQILECAAALLDGRTFVPASFFEEVLGLTYFIDDNGIITISYYSPNVLTQN